MTLALRRLGRSHPRGKYSLSCKSRSSFTWEGMLRSPISSRNSVPSAASSTIPRRSWSAPVKAPRTWPNRVSAKTVSSSPATFTVTSLPRQPESRCAAWATSSFPTPLSPVIRSGWGLLATASTYEKMSSMERSPVTIFENASGCESSREIRRLDTSWNSLFISTILTARSTAPTIRSSSSVFTQ